MREQGWKAFLGAGRIGLILSLALVACAPLGVGSPTPVGCSLTFIDGHLAADSGRVVLLPGPNFVHWGDRVPLDVPDGWTVRSIDDGQLEIVDDMGTVRARTGAGIVLSAVSDPAVPGSPWIRDGELVACPGQWPDNYMDPDYVAPDEDAP